MIGASEAVSQTLLGLRNTLDPSAKEAIEEYVTAFSPAVTSLKHALILYFSQQIQTSLEHGVMYDRTVCGSAGTGN